MATLDSIQPGARVRVHLRIRQQDRWLTATTEGEVVSMARRPTGSWFVHGQGGRLWLSRITLQKPDGEQTELVLDEQAEIEVL